MAGATRSASSELASDGYPHIPLSATVAATVTLSRPLPLDDLHLAIGAPTRPRPP